jgi:hypothetical protein
VSIDGGATYQVDQQRARFITRPLWGPIPVRYGFLHQELNTEYIIIVDKEEYLVTLRKSALFVHEV